MKRGGKMSAPPASHLSVQVLLPVTDAKYGRLTFFYLLVLFHRISISETNRVIHWIMQDFFSPVDNVIHLFEQLGPELIFFLLHTL